MSKLQNSYVQAINASTTRNDLRKVMGVVVIAGSKLANHKNIQRHHLTIYRRRWRLVSVYWVLSAMYCHSCKFKSQCKTNRIERSDVSLSHLLTCSWNVIHQPTWNPKPSTLWARSNRDMGTLIYIKYLVLPTVVTTYLTDVVDLQTDHCKHDIYFMANSRYSTAGSPPRSCHHCVRDWAEWDMAATPKLAGAAAMNISLTAFTFFGTSFSLYDTSNGAQTLRCCHLYSKPIRTTHAFVLN